MSRPHSFHVDVADVIHETADACSVVLAPADADREHFAYRPGQFLTLNIPSDREHGAARCYSLSSCPGVDERLKITVKRTPDGYGSHWICDMLRPGDTLEVLPPAGTFTPRSLDDDFLLVAGGSGITPVMSILKSALSSGRGQVALLYANRDEQSVIFRDELIALTKEYAGRLHVVHLLEVVQGLPSVDALRELAAPYADRQVFVCGPTPFMDAVSSAVRAAGVPRDRVHHERFHSLGNDPFAETSVRIDTGGPAGTLEVELDGTTTALAWPATNRLIDVLLEAGLEAPFSCREGNCSACACFVLEGEVEMDHNEVLEPEDLADGIVLACQARPRSDHVRISYDQ